MNVNCVGNRCDIRDATPFSDPAIAPAPSYPCPLQSSINSPRLSISFKIVFNRCSPVSPVLHCINPTKTLLENIKLNTLKLETSALYC